MKSWEIISKRWSSKVWSIHTSLNEIPYTQALDENISSSIGCISLIQILYLDYEKLGFKSLEDFWLALSDNAMYQSKTSNSNGCFRILDSNSINEICNNFRIALSLESEHLIESVETYFQPIYGKDKIVGLECLARFHSELKGYNVEQIIDISKKNGNDRALFKTLIRSNIETINKLESHNSIQSLAFNYQINIEPFMIENAAEAASLIMMLSTLKVDKNRVFLELSERDFDMTKNDFMHLHNLRNQGYRLSVDDFGTGNSNFKRVIEFNFDQIKLDKCFLTDKSDKSKKILENLTKMMQELDLTVLIEGIETHEQHALCLSFDIPLYQGYLLARPMPMDTVISLIEKNEREIHE